MLSDDWNCIVFGVLTESFAEDVVEALDVVEGEEEEEEAEEVP